MGLGISFVPGQQADDRQQQAPGEQLQQALQLLSLRLPRFSGANAIAPDQLLNAPQNWDELLRRLLGWGQDPTQQPTQGPLNQPPTAPPPTTPIPRVNPGGGPPPMASRPGEWWSGPAPGDDAPPPRRFEPIDQPPSASGPTPFGGGRNRY